MGSWSGSSRGSCRISDWGPGGRNEGKKGLLIMVRYGRRGEVRGICGAGIGFERTEEMDGGARASA